MKIKTYFANLLFLAVLLVSGASLAGVSVDTNENGVTLAGHDVVSYFTQNSAVEGSAELTSVYNNAIYRFSSAENRDLFNADPEKYAPQYGGFCAYGAALGKKFDVNGKAFEIVEGKLYVNKNEDVYEVWAEDKADNIKTGDEKWATIADVPAADL